MRHTVYKKLSYRRRGTARRVVSVNIVRNVAQICVELRVISPATGGDLRHQKNRVPGLLCGTVDVMLRLSVFAEHRLVTDRHRHRAIAYTALAERRAVKTNCSRNGNLFLFKAGLKQIRHEVLTPFSVPFKVLVFVCLDRFLVDKHEVCQ